MSKIADRPCVVCGAEGRFLDRFGWCEPCAAEVDANEPSPEEIEDMARQAEQRTISRTTAEILSQGPLGARRKPATTSGHPLLPPDGLNVADALFWIMTGKNRTDMPF